MSYEEIANDLVSKLNENNVPANEYDEFKLERWYSGVWPVKYYQAVIYHHGGKADGNKYGMIAWTNATAKCSSFDSACEKMIRHLFNTRCNIKIDFNTPEELQMKLIIGGYFCNDIQIANESE